MKQPIDPALAKRVPPGQTLTLKWPVLTYGLFDTVDVALGLNYLRTRVSENGLPAEEQHP